MSAQAVLAKLEAAGLDVAVEGERVNVRGRKGVLNEPMQREVRDNRGELLRLLKDEGRVRPKRAFMDRVRRWPEELRLAWEEETCRLSDWFELDRDAAGLMAMTRISNGQVALPPLSLETSDSELEGLPASLTYCF